MTVEEDTVDGYQVARIRNIPAKRIGDSFTVTVCRETESGTVTYSPLNYCAKALDPSAEEDDRLKEVVKALVLYWQAAQAYFGQN